MSGEALPFEEALERLEEIVHRLEEGEIGLEESLAAYQEGMRLHRLCQERLRRVEEELLVVLRENAVPEVAAPADPDA
jgi:exodeoxyribonuclease VII small subunit